MAGNILIVDDEVALRDILKDVLDEAGYNSEVAASAEEALKIMENYGPDVIVSDVWMPGMDGHEFCRAARDISDASILMMSGVSSEFSALQGKQIDADDFLIKPFDVENFLQRIEALIEMRQTPKEQPLDDEQRLMRMFQALSDARKESFLREAGRIAEAD